MKHDDYYDKGLHDLEVAYKACLYCIIGITALLLLLMLVGCKTVYVPVKEVHTEYVTKTDTFKQKDSIFCHDSVYIHSVGDTVWFEKWHTKYRDKIKEVVRIDSFIKNDSIPVPYPVEKKLTPWQQAKQDFGGYALIIVSFIFVLVVIKVIRWLRRQSMS